MKIKYTTQNNAITKAHKLMNCTIAIQFLLHALALSAIFRKKQYQYAHTCVCVCVCVCAYIYTGCNRRNGPDFGRMFLRSNYTDITQNTYIQSSMVTEILAREV